MLSDLRYALRSLRRAPAFSAVVVVTLMIGVASITTIFSLVNTALLRPLPYRDADRIRAIGENHPHQPFWFSNVSARSVALIQAGAEAFDRLSVYRDRQSLVTVDNVTTPLEAIETDSLLLPLLGIQAQLGRTFSPAEFISGAPVVMISDSAWRTVFHGDSAVVGRSVRVDGTFATVVGVLPRGFRFPERRDIWFPLATSSTTNLNKSYTLLGRLRVGASPERAQQELTLVARSLTAESPGPMAGVSLTLRAGMIDRGNGTLTSVLALIFLAAAACVLLVASVNIGNLLQVRAAERREEMAVRTALGASSGRLMRQNFTESVLLGGIGGLLGTALSVWAVRILLHEIPTLGLPSWLRFGIDIRVVAFALLISLIATIAFGIIPARTARDVDLAKDLKVGGGGTRGRAVVRRGRVGVVIQLALAFVLCSAAAILLQNYRRLSTIDPGYRTTDVWELMPAVNRDHYSDPLRLMTFAQSVTAELIRSNAVAGAAIRDRLARTVFDTVAPRTPSDSIGQLSLFLPNDVTRPIDRDVASNVTKFVVSADYFSVLDLPVLQGRALLASDREGSTPVAVVSQRFAQFVWHSEDVLGKLIQIGPKGTPITVVGVVRDMHPARIGPTGTTAMPDPVIYLSDQQAYGWNPDILIRSAAGALPSSVAATALHRVDPDAGIGRFQTLAYDLDLEALPVRLIGSLVGVFAVSAFGLAMLGIYGVIGYSVAQRTGEIGIRLALGGTSERIVASMVRQGLRLVALGLIIGLALALAIGRMIAAIRFFTVVFDPSAFGAALLIFAVTGWLGCYLPARRASHVDPMEALRAE